MIPITPSGLRIVFFGTPAFAAHILNFVANAGENIVAVVTTPEKQQGRGLKRTPMIMQEAGERLSIPVLAPGKLRDDVFLEELRSFNADLFCVVAYKILPKEVYTMPRLGTFNVHTSLLPKYRGAAPMNWAIINGETETGVTTFLLDEKVDTGNILLQERTTIGPDETVGELHDDLMQLGATLALKTIIGLAASSLTPRSQEKELATPAPKIFPSDCVIDFNLSAEAIHNKIRGLSPIPTAVAVLPNNERMKIFRSSLPTIDNLVLRAGEFAISEDKNRLFVGTSTKPIELLEVQRENKKRISVEEFLRGARNIF
ncbi:MAG: methionyl-tRNA formyltransferase [Ignavibacteriota bacterium]